MKLSAKQHKCLRAFSDGQARPGWDWGAGTLSLASKVATAA